MKRRRLLCAAAATAATGWTALQAQENHRRPAPPRAPAIPKLHFGLITPRNAEVMLRNWAPFLDRMAQAVGVPIEPLTYATAAELVRDFASGRLHMAWMGNAPALEIVEGGHGSVFAVEVVQDKASYRSALITHRDSTLRSLDDVHRLAASLTFGDGDVKSTSGHIVPRYFAFVKRGVNDPDRMFKEVRRGSHEANLLSTVKREVDVATSNTSELENFRTTKAQEAAQVRVIWESPEIPTSPMVWRNDLPPALKQKISTFTFTFAEKNPQDKEILWNMNKLTAWRKSSNRQLVPIADLEMFNARQRAMNDVALSTDQRLQQVDQITRRGSRLELMLKASAQSSASL